MLKNIISNWMEIIVTTLAVFVLYPFLVDTMGKSQYGVWLLIASLTGYFNMLQLGIPAAVVKHISGFYAEKKIDKVNQVVNSSLSLFLGLAFIVLIAGIIIMFSADKIFKIPPEYVNTAKIAIIIVTVNVALNFVFEVFEGIMHAFENFVILNAIKVSLIIVRVIVTFIVITFKNGLMALAIILAGISLLQGIGLWLYIKNKYRFLRFSFNLFDKEIVRQIFHYSVYALLLQLAARLAFQTDPMVIGMVISTSAIVYFSVGNNFMIYLMEFIRGISRALMPKSSSLDSQDKQKQIREIYLRYSRLTFLIVLMAGLLLILFGKDFIAMWMGESFREPSGNVLIILAISYIFFLVQRGIGHPILMGMSKLKFPTFVMLGGALLNFLISIYLGKIYNIYGVALGTAIPNILVTILFIWYTTRLLKINIFSYLGKTMIFPSLSGLLIVIPALIIKRFIEIDSYLKFFTITGALAGIYLVGVFLFILKEEKILLLQKLKKTG